MNGVRDIGLLLDTCRVRIGTAYEMFRTVQATGVLKRPSFGQTIEVLRSVRKSGPAGLSSVLAALYGDKQAIVDDHGVWSYSELAARTNRLTRAFNAVFADSKSRNIGIVCRNSAWFMAVTSASSASGSSLIFMSTDSGAAQLEDIVKREDIGVLIYDEDMAGAVQGVSVPGGKYVAWYESSEPGNSLERWTAPYSDSSPRRPTTHARTVLLTSGSSGVPKAAARQVKPDLTTPIGSLQKIPLRNDDRVLICAPVFHGWGYFQAMLSLLVGATLILPRRFDAPDVAKRLEQQRCTVLVAVPTMLKRLVDVVTAAEEPYTHSALRVIASGGSRIDAQLVAAIHAQFGPVLRNFYGSSESSYVTIATPEDLAIEPTCAGRPPFGISVTIRDENGNVLPTGTTGEIYVKTPTMISEYGDGRKRKSVDGFMAMGDSGRLDRDGRLFIEGRVDRMIVSGGENVFPEEVEQLLITHTAISDVVIVPVSDPEYGERLRAFVVADQPVSVPELKEFVSQGMSRAKVPREFIFVEELPRGATGKVTKAALDSLAEQHLHGTTT